MGVTYSHGFLVGFGVHGHALLSHGRQQLEVVDVMRRRERVEELRFLIERVGECMRRSSGHRDEVTGVGIDYLTIRCEEAKLALSH